MKETPLKHRTVHGRRRKNLSVGLPVEAQPSSSGEAEKLMMLEDGVVVAASSRRDRHKWKPRKFLEVHN